MTTKKAMILAAGFGTRLGSMTKNIPKPLIKVFGKELLAHSIDALISIGIKEIFINTHYRSKLINDFVKFKYNSSFIKTFYEPIILDTGGGVKNIVMQNNIEDLMVINSDIYWNKKNYIDLSNLLKEHKKNKFGCTLLLSKLGKSYGLLESKGDFVFKNDILIRNSSFNKGLIYSGAQVLNGGLLNKIDKKIFSLNYFWDIQIKNENITGFIMNSNWIHLGNVQGFAKLDNFRA